MQTDSIIFGIYVSKDHLDIYEISFEQQRFFQLSNTSTAILEWINKLPCIAVRCILEPTGSYSQKLLYYLTQQGITVHLVNPTQSSAFAQVLGLISKDDRQAAQILALMGQRLELPVYQAPSLQMNQRKQLLTGIQALKKQHRMLSNQLHALQAGIIFEPKVIEALQATRDMVDQQLKNLEEQLLELDDEDHQQELKLLQSIVGIGPKTAQLLLSATGGLHHFQFARQVSKFVGLVPWSHQSGSSIRRKGPITKRGCRTLRSSLYMAARSAAQHNHACKDLYQRLRAAGKPHKQVMVAVMNKLIKQAFGVVRSGVPFDNQYYLKFTTN